MRRLILAILLAALASAFAGCTSAPDGEQTRNPTFNDTDVMFLQMMIAHHAPADEILALARARATREDIKTLAAAVQVTQADETRTMTEWLQSWGEPLVSTASADAHSAHGGALPQADAEIKALKEATNADFDRVFITIFSGYQQTAVTLARMEINGGAASNALDLARRVDENRRAQIDLMARWSSGG